jgi:hypothetical protein
MTGLTTREFTGRPKRPHWLTATYLIVPTVVLVTVASLVLGNSGGQQATQQPPPAPATAAPTSTAVAAGGGALKQPSDPDYLTAAPAAMRFQDVGGAALPFSPVDGPLRINGPLAAGYSHTPQGAVLAAMQLLIRLAYLPGWAQVMTEQTVWEGPARDKAITQRNSTPQWTPAEIAAQIMTPIGFRVESYTPSQATIVLLVKKSDQEGYDAPRVVVAWAQGDWKFTVTDASGSIPVDSTVGYTLF